MFLTWRSKLKYEQMHIISPEKLKLMGNKRWTCFYRFHVTTATIGIGLWHMGTHLFAFMILTAAYLMPECCKATTFYNMNEKYEDLDSSTSSVYLSACDNAVDLNFFNHWRMLSVLSFLCSFLLIYGVITKRSYYILPFLMMQVFDIFLDFTILNIHFLFSSSTNEFLNQLKNPPLRKFLVHFKFYHKTLVAALFIIISFCVKTYLLNVVYRCYQFLTIFISPSKRETSFKNVH